MSIDNILFNAEGKQVPARPKLSTIEVGRALERCWSEHYSELGLFLKSLNSQAEVTAMIASDDTRNTFFLARNIADYLISIRSNVVIDWKGLEFLNTFLRFVESEESASVRAWFHRHRPVCPAEVGSSVYDAKNSRLLKLESVSEGDWGMASCRGLDENGHVMYVHVPFENINEQKDVRC